MEEITRPTEIDLMDQLAAELMTLTLELEGMREKVSLWAGRLLLARMPNQITIEDHEHGN